VRPGPAPEKARGSAAVRAPPCPTWWRGASRCCARTLVSTRGGAAARRRGGAAARRRGGAAARPLVAHLAFSILAQALPPFPPMRPSLSLRPFFLASSPLPHLPILLPPGLKVSCRSALNPQRSISCASAGCEATSLSLRRGVPSPALKALEPVPPAPGELLLYASAASGGDSAQMLTRSCFRGVCLLVLPAGDGLTAGVHASSLARGASLSPVVIATIPLAPTLDCRESCAAALGALAAVGAATTFCGGICPGSSVGYGACAGRSCRGDCGWEARTARGSAVSDVDCRIWGRWAKGASGALAGPCSGSSDAGEGGEDDADEDEDDEMEVRPPPLSREPVGSSCWGSHACAV